MIKEDVLKKSREENLFLDEREKHELANSFGFGGVVVGILCLMFCTIKAIKGQSFHEYVVIFCGYMAGTTWRSYIVAKKKIYLIQAVAYSLIAFLGLISYFALV